MTRSIVIANVPRWAYITYGLVKLPILIAAAFIQVMYFPGQWGITVAVAVGCFGLARDIERRFIHAKDRDEAAQAVLFGADYQEALSATFDACFVTLGKAKSAGYGSTMLINGKPYTLMFGEKRAIDSIIAKDGVAYMVDEANKNKGDGNVITFPKKGV